MNCDSYCSQRARTFFDPVAALGKDNKVHGVLAESITPNADFTQWTLKIRSGISFTDGTPVNADAIIRNLEDAGTGVLISGSLTDIAKIADPSGAKNDDGTPKMILKIVKDDDSSLTILPPPGCRFNTRCPAATDVCRSTEPQLREVDAGHFVACHHPLFGDDVAVAAPSLA
ncbi:MAG: oligopeptide/dipeptide ABC transporter ATP-binding protein [Ilumatobacteraceae bacterium]